MTCRGINHCTAMKKLTRGWQLFVMSCLLLALLPSCGSDEPEGMTVDYYIEIEEVFLVNGSTSRVDRYKESNPITMMREAIRTAYPKLNTVGDDHAVIEACDKVYDSFYEMYSGRTEDHLTALVHLKKVNKEGDLVRQSEYLKTYNINVNPPAPEQ